MFDYICQIAILIGGTLTMFLLAQKNKWMRWGYIIGLVQESFWFYTTVYHHQWGVFLLCFVYTFCFLLGIYNYWIREIK